MAGGGKELRAELGGGSGTKKAKEGDETGPEVERGRALSQFVYPGQPRAQGRKNLQLECQVTQNSTSNIFHCRELLEGPPAPIGSV